jgi:integrase
MPRTLRDSNLGTREQRLRLKIRPKPYWRLLEPGLHVGYRRLAGRPGSWCVRRYVGAQQYAVESLNAVADDNSDANGHDVLDFRQAQRRALDRKPKVAAGAITVADALKQYLADLAHRGRPTRDTAYRVDALIVPALGTIAVEALTSEQIRAWHAGLAKAAARHGRKGDDGEAERRRRSSANRTLTVLRAALNHCFREGRTPSDAQWRRVRPFQSADAARVHYLKVDEAKRLINACSGDFRMLVLAGLQTGCRYGELGKLQARDFNTDSGTVTVRQSKSGKSRHVVLTDEGVALFRRWCAGKAGGDLILTCGSAPWGKSLQDLRMRAACERARIDPPANFHCLRHTYASLSIMAGVPLLVVSRNLGHRDGRMVELHYGHLASSYVADAIRNGAPKFGIKPDEKITALGGR